MDLDDFNTLSDWTRATIGKKPAHVKATEKYARLPKGARSELRKARMQRRQKGSP